jgi:hypothetical protein
MKELPHCRTVIRPQHDAQMQFEASPKGVLGNFQNWIQAAMDLLVVPSSDQDSPVMLCEDDVIFSVGTAEIVEKWLWPSEKCGAMTLFRGGHRANAPFRVFSPLRIAHSGSILSRKNNLIGALAIIFRRKTLEQIVASKDSIARWGGSHHQAASGCAPWERKAVDTWIGREVVKAGYEIWGPSRSLVMHYAPDGVSNSYLGNGANEGCRKESGFEHRAGKWGVRPNA